MTTELRAILTKKRSDVLTDVRKAFTVTVKAADPNATDAGGRYVDVVASTPAEDSDGEILIQDWDLSRYEKNPVVLYGHNRPGGWCSDVDAEDTLPIGYATNVRVEGDQLKARLNFVDANASPLAERVYQGMKQGSLRAVSVGFCRTKETNARLETHDGFDVFVVSGLQLVEISVVPVPANPEAVAEERAKSLDAIRSLTKSHQENRPMKLALLIATALGLSAETSEEEGAKAIGEMRKQEAEILSLTGKKSLAEALGTIAGWKIAAERGAEASAKLVELEGKRREDEVARILETGEKAGKITPANRVTYLAICGADDKGKGADPAKLSALVEALPVVAQLGGKGHEEPEPAPPGTKPAATFQGDPKRHPFALMGVTAEQVAKSNEARAKRKASAA